MGRRCKKCEKPQICRSATLCPTCEVEAIEPSDKTDAEFAKLFEEYHERNVSTDAMDGDIFKHRERLNRLAATTENKAELEQLASIQDVIEAKKELLKNKLFVSAMSVNINKNPSPQKDHYLSQLASPNSTLASVKFVEKAVSPLKDVLDHNANVISEAPLSYSELPSIRKAPGEIKKVMDFVEDVTDEIDGNCIFKEEVGRADEDEDLEPTTRKVVRRRSSVKDRIKAFEMLSKRFTL